MTMPDPRLWIARRAVDELQPGDVINLGIGIPTTIVEVVPPELHIHFHTENGLLGMGPLSPANSDPDIINAGKLPVGETVGAAYFDSVESFAMIRGGHVDVAMLGALEVDERGRVANWTAPGKPVLGVGGAMDLLEGAKRVYALMMHTARNGAHKLVAECGLALTSMRPADTIITNLGVFRVEDETLYLDELAPGVSVDEVAQRTSARFEVGDRLSVRSFGRSPAE